MENKITVKREPTSDDDDDSEMVSKKQRTVATLVRRIKEMPSEVPQEYICPFSGQIMYDPVVISNGNVFEGSCIRKWFEKHEVCPVSGKSLDDRSVIPLPSMKSLIAKFMESNPNCKAYEFFPFGDYLKNQQEFLDFVNGSTENYTKMKNYLTANKQELTALDELLRCELRKGSELTSSQKEGIRILLKFGANPNLKVRLYSKFRDYTVPIFCLLLEKKEFEFAKEWIQTWKCKLIDTSSTILHWIAAYNSDMKFVRYVVEELEVEDYIDCGDATGNTPLHFAARNEKSHDILIYFLSLQGVEVDYENDSSETPLYEAIKNRCWKNTQHLLAQEAKIDVVDNNGDDAFTLLLREMRCVREEDRALTLEMLKVMLQNGYSLSAKSKTQELINNIKQLRFRNQILEICLFAK